MEVITNMVQPIKLKNEKVLKGAWTPKGKVWYQKNDDSHLGSEETIKEKQDTADRRITELTKGNFKNYKHSTRRY